MRTLRSILKNFLLAIGSGFCIGIGGTVSLSLENRIAGAFFFTVGLFSILIFGFYLFTGMVGYLSDRLFEKKPAYLGILLCVWLGNFFGTALFAGLIRNTRVGNAILPACNALMEVKLADSFVSLLILGIFCGVLMFLAVDTYKKHSNTHPILAYIAVILGVMVFILAGFEHCIANMFYVCLTGRLGESVGMLLTVTLGNAIGGNLIPLLLRATKKEEVA